MAKRAEAAFVRDNRPVQPTRPSYHPIRIKLKDVYALRRIPLREKDFGWLAKVLSGNIPDRARTCNLRLRRPPRFIRGSRGNVDLSIVLTGR
jgi:hypothetical protein